MAALINFQASGKWGVPVFVSCSRKTGTPHSPASIQIFKAVISSTSGCKEISA